MSASLSPSPIHINNHGVELMHRGDHIAAIKLFGKALTALKRSMSLRCDSGHQLSNGEDEGDSFISPSFFSTPDAHDQDIDDDDPFVHTSGIVMSTSTDQKQYDMSESFFDVATRVIVVNLAMAHHLRAIETGKSWKQARLLYQVALRSLQGTSHVSIAMAVYNNLGHVYRRMGDEASATTCHERLLSMLMSCVDMDAEALDCRCDMLFDGLLRTVSPLIFGSSSSPAPAA